MVVLVFEDETDLGSGGACEGGRSGVGILAAERLMGCEVDIGDGVVQKAENGKGERGKRCACEVRECTEEIPGHRDTRIGRIRKSALRSIPWQA